MDIVGEYGKDELATVYLAEMGEGRLVEFVESIQPPIPREKKWVMIVSTMLGCPVGCMMCDAGGDFKGKLSADEMLAQIDHMIKKRFPDGDVPVEKFKIQFARMGEPALNKAVLEVLREMPKLYNVPGLIPSVSTVAPHSANGFMEELLEIKNELYGNGNFQMQFSIHTTDEEQRDKVIPIRKWSLSDISEYGERFYRPGDRKITLNFALAKGAEISPEKLLSFFDPGKFVIKLTPINPTIRATENKLESEIGQDEQRTREIVDSLESAGFEVILSIGELEENDIGSNCGQYVKRYLSRGHESAGGYRTEEYRAQD